MFFAMCNSILKKNQIFGTATAQPAKAEAQVWSRNTWQNGPDGPDGPDGHAAVAAKPAAVVCCALMAAGCKL